MFVEGSLQTRKWQDQQGQDRYTTEIKAQRVQFLDKRGGEQGGMPSGAGGSEGGYSAPRRPAAAQQGGGSRPATPTSSGRTITKDLGPAFPPRTSGMDDAASKKYGEAERNLLQKGSLPFPSLSFLPRRLTDEEAATEGVRSEVMAGE